MKLFAPIEPGMIPSSPARALTAPLRFELYAWAGESSLHEGAIETDVVSPEMDTARSASRFEREVVDVRAPFGFLLRKRSEPRSHSEVRHVRGRF